MLLGAQAPRILHVPAHRWSDADDAAYLAESYGLMPDEWQHLVLTGWLARGREGKWAAGRCGLAVPRQNGKNGCLEIRELYGMVVLGERILHTAHQVKTARKAFLRLLGFFGDGPNDPNAKYPELNALVVEVRKTNGQEAIVLSNGASIEFIARSKSSGRGFTVDVLVLDEAQDLTDEDVEALQPTISAAPLGNPQTIMTGTPPPPNSPVGKVWTRTREAGVRGNAKRLCWHEWSVEGDVDIFDRKLWAQTNPALGRRLNESVVVDELPPTMTAEGFARERLGKWWDPTTDDGAVFPTGAWAKARDEKSEPGDRRVFAIDVTPDSAWSTIAATSWRDDELIHGQVLEHHEGTGWTVDRTVELVERWGQHGPVILCGRAAAMFRDALEDRGVDTHVLSAGEMLAASSELHSEVVGTPPVEDDDGELQPARPGRLRHLGQKSLDAAVRAATRKHAPDGWYWARRTVSVPVSPLISLSGAVWGLTRLKKTYNVLESIW